MTDWKKVRLGDVCILEKGAQIDTSQLENSKPYRYINGGIKESGYYDQFNTSGESVLISEGGASCGYINYVNENFWCGCHCYRLQDIKVFPKYLYYALKGNQDRIMSLRAGSTMPNIQKSIIQKFELSIHNQSETQKQIAATLDKVTKIIEENKQLLEKYDLLIKSRFIEMFGDPVQNPMGWEVKKLGNMCSVIMNGTTPKGGEQVYVKNGITFLRSQNVWRNKIDLEDVAYIDEATHKLMKKSSLKKYDILMTKTGRINTENSSLGRAALFMGEDDSANINGHVYLIRLEKEYNHEFVIKILTSPEYRDYIRSVCVGGIDKRQINKDHIEDFPIIQPPIEIQQQFAQFVQQIDKSKFAVQKSLEKAEILYKSLMQRYFA